MFTSRRLSRSLVLFALSASCKHAGNGQVKAEADAENAALLLGASDLSILFPLKPIAKTGASDPFKREGTGFQNSPTLDSGEYEPILSQGLFQSFVDDAFGRSQPELRGSCLEPRIADEQFNANDEKLLLDSQHVALVRSLDTRVCDYKSWRVVAFRFDPCLERPKIPDLHTLTRWPEGCRTAEARLVVQPFVFYAGSWTAIDASMHLIYHLPHTEELVDGLRSIQKTSRQVLAETTDTPPIPYNPRLLTPHPGLWAELNRENGPVAQSIRALLSRFTIESRLSGIAWMSSSQGSTHWSFATRKVAAGQLIPSDNLQAESFSSNVLGEGHFPFSPMPLSGHTLEEFFRKQPQDFAPADLSRIHAKFEAIQDPRQVSQILSGQHASSCVSCHMVDQSQRRLADSRHEADPTRKSLGPGSLEVWPPLRERSFTNLRNFGYGPAFSFGVSKRAARETEDLIETVRIFFPMRPRVLLAPMQSRTGKPPLPPLPPTRFGN